MCDIDAYVIKGGNEERVMENLERVESVQEGLRLQNIFGEEMILPGRLVFYDSSLKKMIFSPT